MTDPTPQGSAFGAVQQAPMTVVPESLRPPVHYEEQQPAPSAVPAPLRARLTDRLQKRVPRETVVDVSENGDGSDRILVRGMDSYAIEKLTEGQAPPEEGQTPKITENQPRMLRAMCFDPEDGSSLFGSGNQVGVHPETDQPIIDGWTDVQINKLPMDVTNKLMTAVNFVMGRGAEPGKDSPSTPDTASSSS